MCSHDLMYLGPLKVGLSVEETETVIAQKAKLYVVKPLNMHQWSQNMSCL